VDDLPWPSTKSLGRGGGATASIAAVGVECSPRTEMPRRTVMALFDSTMRELPTFQIHL
jgi:hypothetical protein